MHFWKKVEDAEKIGVLKTEKMSNVKENVENKVLKLRGTKSFLKVHSRELHTNAIFKRDLVCAKRIEAI